MYQEMTGPDTDRGDVDDLIFHDEEYSVSER